MTPYQKAVVAQHLKKYHPRCSSWTWTKSAVTGAVTVRMLPQRIELDVTELIAK